MARLTVAADEERLSDTAADRVTTLLQQTTSSRGAALVSLTGGSTPRRLYARLADASAAWRPRIQWPQLHVFWGDERHVPPDHPESNYRMAKEALLDHVPIPREQVHRMRGELADAQDAAAEYEQTLADAFRSAGREDRAFDVMLLGVGEDGHIASIFPGSELLSDDTVGHPLLSRRVAAVWASHLNTWRITLTPAATLDAHAILVLVSGARKADAVKNAIEGPLDVNQ